MTTCGLVLAAGRSTRFGAADKLLADFRGRPLAAHAAAAMRAVPLDHRLVAVADPAVQALFGGFEPVAPNGPDARQSESLARGARRAGALGADRLLVTLADMPLVDPDHLAAVLASCADGRPAATTDGERLMPPVCFPGDWLARLTRIEGDRGASALLAGREDVTHVRAPASMLVDIDRPGDLRALWRADRRVP